MIARENALGEAVTAAVFVVADVREEMFDAETSGAGEVVGNFDGLGAEAIGAGTGGGDGKEFRADIDETTEQQLLPLEFRPKPGHRMKKRPCETPRGPRGPADVIT
jgi:hypothetical protein